MIGVPKIVVIVPIYNVELYIHRCVDSILNQTFTNFELILVDDGSPDDCGKICDEYAQKDNRVHVIHQENSGLSAARNTGIDWAFRNSDSEWLTFIDSDDWVHNRYLELLYNTATSNNSEISCCGCMRTKKYIKDKCINSYEVECRSLEQLILDTKNYDSFNSSVAWGRLYKKNRFNSIRFPVGRLHEDEYVTYKILFPCKNICVVKEALYYYFQNESGIMHTASVKKIEDQFGALKEQMQFYVSNGCEVLFQKTFFRYCWIINQYYSEYKNDGKILKLLKGKEKIIKYFTRRFPSIIPEPAKKYGYKKWVTREYLKIENLKNDFRSVKDRKGLLYSLIWAMKIKIKNK